MEEVSVILFTSHVLYVYLFNEFVDVEAEMSSFTNLLTKLDEVLEKNNVDSSSCAQRITCSFVQSSLNNMSGGNGTDIDKFVAVLSG